MSISSTVLIYLAIPAGIIALVAALVLGGNDRTRRTPRYRPGRPYDFQPIWFLASPDRIRTAADGPNGQDSAHPALEGPVLEDSTGARVLPGPTGGASDSW